MQNDKYLAPEHATSAPPTHDYNSPQPGPLQNNPPQSYARASGAAALIFISGGMNIAWSMGFRTIYYFALPLHTRIAWFFGAIIGAVFSCFLANKLPKKIVLCFSSLLVIIGGIIMASTHWDTQVLEASIYLDGIANGLAFAPTMALAGEVAVSYVRGYITASIEQKCVTLGVFIQIAFVTSWSTSDQSLYDFNKQQMQGFTSVVCGVIALIIAALWCIESPVIMLANGEEQQAIDALRRLQRPYTVTTETYAQLEEHKRYLAQNKDLSNAQSISQAMLPFIKLCCLRGLNVMSLSTFVVYALLIPVFRNNVYTVGFNTQYLLFGVFRWMGTFITSYCMESVGRKKPTLMGLLVSSSFAFGIAKTLNDIPSTDFESIFWLLCVYQLFAGIAFTSTSSYMSEAYPLGVKQHFIGSTYIVEMLLFIFIAPMDYTIEGHVIYYYALGGLSVVGSIIGIFCLPETRRTTLRESQDKFRGLLSTVTARSVNTELKRRKPKYNKRK